MAEVRYQPQTQTQVAIDQGLRSYMLKVYNYMAAGLGITAVAAVGTYNAAADGAGFDLVVRAGGEFVDGHGAAVGVESAV